VASAVAADCATAAVEMLPSIAPAIIMMKRIASSLIATMTIM
jgi:hypothetical protein